MRLINLIKRQHHVHIKASVCVFTLGNCWQELKKHGRENGRTSFSPLLSLYSENKNTIMETQEYNYGNYVEVWEDNKPISCPIYANLY